MASRFEEPLTRLSTGLPVTHIPSGSLDEAASEAARAVALLADLQGIDFAGDEAARQKQRYLALLLSKGLAKTGDPALPTYQGTALTIEGFADYMALLRSVRINMEFSGSLCRGLKGSRYKELVMGADGPVLMDMAPEAHPATSHGPDATQAEHCG